MEKAPPPPYQESMYPPPGYNPQPGFNQQPGFNPPLGFNQQSGYNYPPSQPQGYPPPPLNQPQGYPPPPLNQPQGYPLPHNQTQGNIVIATSPVCSTFGPNPQPLTCPHCHHAITTRVETESATKTHILAAILCLVGCIPCCLIPYCTDACQNQNHYCPSCSAYLGSYTN